jgi:hypothetical protein
LHGRFNTDVDDLNIRDAPGEAADTIIHELVHVVFGMSKGAWVKGVNKTASRQFPRLVSRPRTGRTATVARRFYMREALAEKTELNRMVLRSPPAPNQGEGRSL